MKIEINEKDLTDDMSPFVAKVIKRDQGKVIIDTVTMLPLLDTGKRYTDEDAEKLVRNMFLFTFFDAMIEGFDSTDKADLFYKINNALRTKLEISGKDKE